MAEKPPQDGVQEALAHAAARRRETRRKWAERKLAESQANRKSAAVPTQEPRRKSKRTKGGAKWSKRARAAALDQAQVDALVTKEAQQHGDYQMSTVRLDEVVKKGKVKTVEHRGVRNVGGSAIERWYAKGGLDERQMQAILFYQNAHRTAFGTEPKVTANYSPVIIRGLRSSVELYAGSVIAARESLRLLDNEVFFWEKVEHFQVWQNVVIFDKPAGVAAACAGFVVKKSAEAAAKAIVGGMAHKIANIVIDQSRRDFGDLLLDLDAPRKPRGCP